MAIYYITGVVFLLLAGILTAILTVMFRRARAGAALSESPADFFVEKYRPLARLFDPADLVFLRSHPGHDRAAAKRFQRRRRAAASMFLSELSSDFNRLFRMAKQIAASGEDRPGIVSELIGQWFSFHLAVLSLRARLWFSPLGIIPVNPAELVDRLARIQSAAMLASPGEQWQSPA
jgi:hypothetical protein